MATRMISELAKIKREGGVILPKLKKAMFDEFNKENEHDLTRLFPSEMANNDWCLRTTYYRLHDGWVPPEEFDFVLQNIYAEGNAIHDKWQRRMRATGELWGSWKCLICGLWWHETLEPEPDLLSLRHLGIDHLREYKEVPMQDPELRVSGRADGAMGSQLIEIKSIGKGTLRHDVPALLEKYRVGKLYDLDTLWKELRRPLTPHLRQGNLYAWLAAGRGYTFDSVSYLYEFKVNQQTKEFVVRPSDDILAPMLEKARDVLHAVITHIPPPCPAGGCKQCQSIEQEHNVSAKSFASAGIPSDGSVEPKSEPRAGEAKDTGRRVGYPTRRTASKRAQRPDGASRQATDGVVQPAQPLVEVSSSPAQRRPGGRKVRRGGSQKARGVRPDQESR